MQTKSPGLKTAKPFDHMNSNAAMDATSKRTSTSLLGQTSHHESLVSEAASTLAHLATVAGAMSHSTGTDTAAAASDNAGIQIPPIPIVPNSRLDPSATLAQADGENARQATADGVSVAELIKEAVLRRLSRPEDIVKRNMFAVEGKSIKFPVKVSHCMREYRYNAIRKPSRCFNTSRALRHGPASVFFIPYLPTTDIVFNHPS